MTTLATATKASPVRSTKQWLYSVRAIERRKRALMCEISDLKTERETVFDVGTVFYGDTRVQNSRAAAPTENKARTLCDKLTARLDALLSELERLTLEADAVRDEVNLCFEQTDMTVREFEAIFYYFFEGMSNGETAEAMFYSEDMVFKLKGSGLAKLSKWRRSKNA